MYVEVVFTPTFPNFNLFINIILKSLLKHLVYYEEESMFFFQFYYKNFIYLGDNKQNEIYKNSSLRVANFFLYRRRLFEISAHKLLKRTQ